MFEARVGDRELQGVDILKFDDDGRIAELTVMVRPMSGMHALAEAMQRSSRAHPRSRLSASANNSRRKRDVEIAKVGVVGCGLMGHGIAQICAQAGWDVVVCEVDQGALDKGLGKIDKQLARAVEKGKLEQADADAIRGRIDGCLDYDDLADCDLVIEAITEDLDAQARDVARGRRDRQARRLLRHQHLVALGRRPGGGDRPRRPLPRACTSSTRRR